MRGGKLPMLLLSPNVLLAFGKISFFFSLFSKAELAVKHKLEGGSGC